MNPVVVHVVRPYSSEQDYLAAEAWSIEPRGMLLVDVGPLPVDTAVLFDVALSDGQKPIRAEGRVLGPVAASGQRPGGLRVRFKRFGAATKAFIERAVNAKCAAGEPERPSQVELDRPSQVELDRPSQPDAEPPSQRDAERPSQVDMERYSLPEVRPSMTDLEAVLALGSGVRQRIPGPVDAPANREELLARLRNRRTAG